MNFEFDFCSECDKLLDLSLMEYEISWIRCSVCKDVVCYSEECMYNHSKKHKRRGK